MAVLRRALVATIVLTGSAVLWAQTAAKPGEMVKRSATIETIDATDRIVTLKGEDGTESRVWAPPAMARFDDLKVGDRVNLTYYESTVYQIRKPGDKPVATSGTTTVTPAGGALPGGTVARQTTSSVTVQSIDSSVPSITVTTADGHAITHKVADKSNLEGVKVGDRIDITYTEAVLASVERSK
jgi:Cu/Ag efflux protein CusF